MLEPVDPQSRHNTLMLGSDWISFGVAMSLVSSSTVLPAFVSRLSDLPVLVGLVSTIGSGGWLLPQLLSASRISHYRLKKRFLVVPGLIGRPSFWITAILLLAVGARQPALVLTVFFLGLTLFNVCDGVGAVAWFDIFSKAIPARARGRVIGTLQLVGALLGMAVGLLVQYLLGDASPLLFPANFAALFLLAGVFLGISTFSCSRIREPEGVAPPPRVPLSEYAGRLATVLRTDPDFRRITALRLSLGISGMASPFFVVYATNEVGLGTGVVGAFLTAQVAGGLVGSVGLAYLTERSGSRLTTIIETLLAVATPALAIVVALTLPSNPGAFTLAYACVFALMGANMSAFMLGHMNYLMEMSPPGERATYVGLSNTITGLLVVAPLFAGWIVQATSYETLFALSALAAVPSVLFGLRLREPRRSKPQALDAVA